MAELVSKCNAEEIMIFPVYIASDGAEKLDAASLSLQGYKGLVQKNSKGIGAACFISNSGLHCWVKNPPRLGCRATLQEMLKLVLNKRCPLLVIEENGKVKGIVPWQALLAKTLGNWLELDRYTKVLMNTVHDAVAVVDKNKKVIGWNRRAEILYGIPAEKILGRPISDFFSNLVITRALEENKEFKDAYHQPAPHIHVLIDAGLVHNGNEILGGISAERDITGSVNLSQELSRGASDLPGKARNTSPLKFIEPFRKIKGGSLKLLEVKEMARKMAATNATVVIYGESGTGKELFAEAIHLASSRGKKPFIIINCGAIPPTLFESELFGYQAGAFTGADKKGRPGKFEIAHGGTIFLDEIGELRLDLQVKILRVLQNQKFYRVGGNEPIDVDVRILAATHRNLEEMVDDGKFRQDLFYRLNVISLEIPPLKERREDIPELVQLFVQKFSREHNSKVTGTEPGIMEALLAYSWPGNVRELSNVVERLVILAEEDIICYKHLPDSIKFKAETQKEKASSLAGQVELTERSMIINTLEETGGNKKKAAKLLGIPRSTLYYKLRSLGIKE